MGYGCGSRPALAGIASARSKQSGEASTLQDSFASYGLAGTAAAGAGGAPTTGIVRRALRHRVWIWDGSAWAEDPDLIATGDATIMAGREIGTLTFEHHYGKILRLRASAFETFAPKEDELVWRYVRVTVLVTLNEGGPDQRVMDLPVWYGIIVAPDARREELRTHYVAWDFRYLMQGIQNSNGWFEAPEWSPGSANIQSFRGLELNDNEIHNLPIQGPDSVPVNPEGADIFAAGNRSASTYDPTNIVTDSAEGTVSIQPSGAAGAVYIFGGAGGPENIWTHRQMLDYFVALYLNRPSNKPTGFPIEWRVTGADLLDTALIPETNSMPADQQAEGAVKKIAQLDFRNKSLLDIVDEICRSAGDLSWNLRVSESSGTHIATIAIFDRSAEPDKNGGGFRQVNLANGQATAARIVDIDNPNTDYTPRAGHVVKDSSARINRLVVVGARRRYLTTFANFRLDGKGNPSFVRGWNQDNEDIFRATLQNANAGNDANEQARNEEQQERFDEVWRRYVVPDEFNWGDVEPFLGVGNRRAIFPKFDLAKDLDGVYKFTKDDGPFPNAAVNFWFHPRRFLPKLPIKVGYDYGSYPPTLVAYADRPPKGIGEFSKSLLFSVNVNALLVVQRDLNYANGPPLIRLQDFQELEDTAGIKLSQYSWNITRHPESAKIDMTGESEVQYEPTTILWPYDGTSPDGDDLDDSKIAGQNYEAWKTLAATVVLEADDRLMYIVEDTASIARGDPPRTLVIENEEFHYWEARDALVTDTPVPLVIGQDGDPFPYVLRDDTEKIIDYANRTFRKLSGEKREAAIGFDLLDLTWEPGMFVGWVRKQGPDHVKVWVGAPVMTVTHNFQDNRTTLVTQYDAAAHIDDLR